MKKLFFAVIAFTIVSTIFIACSKDETKQTDNETLFASRFGISKIEKKVSVNLKKLNGLKIQPIRYTSKLTDSLSIADEVFQYADGSKAYIFKYVEGENFKEYIVKVNELGDVLTEKNIEIAKALLNTLNFTTYVYSVDENKSYSVQILNGVAQEEVFIDVNGKRNKGESFGHCFVRTWNEFVQDTLGILAMVAEPEGVTAMCALSCA